MPRIARQRQEDGNRVKRSGEQRSNSVKVAALQMKKVKTDTKDICEQLDVPIPTFNRWVMAGRRRLPELGRKLRVKSRDLHLARKLPAPLQ